MPIGKLYDTPLRVNTISSPFLERDAQHNAPIKRNFILPPKKKSLDENDPPSTSESITNGSPKTVPKKVKVKKVKIVKKKVTKEGSSSSKASSEEKEEPYKKTVHITGAVEMKGIVGSDGRCGVKQAPAIPAMAWRPF